MKFLLMYLITFYWIVKPNKKPKCIFRKSCSHYVYEELKDKGFLAGCKALNFRIKNCKSGFEIFRNPINHKLNMMLPNKDIIDEEEIAERLLK